MLTLRIFYGYFSVFLTIISCSCYSCCLSLAISPSVWSYLSAFFNSGSFVRDTPFFQSLPVKVLLIFLCLVELLPASSRRPSRCPLVRTCCSRSLLSTCPSIWSSSLSCCLVTNRVCVHSPIWLCTSLPCVSLLWHKSCFWLNCFVKLKLYTRQGSRGSGLIFPTWCVCRGSIIFAPYF